MKTSIVNNRISGFSIIELVVVLLVGSILTSIALQSFGGVTGRYAVTGAQRTLMGLHARTRAQAVELGTTVQLNLDPAGDSVWVSRGGDVLEVLDFRAAFEVDLVTSTSSTVELCMSARGFADTACNNFTSTVTVTFALTSDSASVRLLTLGQMVAN